MFILVKAAFFKENSNDPVLLLKNEQTKTDILMKLKLTRNLAIIASSLWTSYKLNKIYMCVKVRIGRALPLSSVYCSIMDPLVLP